MLFTVIVTNDVGQGAYKSFHQRYVVEILYNLNIPKLSLKDKEKSITQNEIEIENEIENEKLTEPFYFQNKMTTSNL